MQATLLIQKVKVCLSMPWSDPARQPGPSACAQDPGVSYGKALDLQTVCCPDGWISLLDHRAQAMGCC